MVEGHEAVDQVTPEEVSKVIEHEFDVRKAWIQAVAVLIKSVIAFYFVLIIVAYVSDLLCYILSLQSYTM